MKNSSESHRWDFLLLLSLCIAMAIPVMAHAQSTTRYLGTVAAITGSNITVKTAQGEEHTVEVPASATLKRIEPGQTDLKAAATMQFSELVPGDRVLVWLAPNAAGTTPQVIQLVAIKASDLEKRRQQEAEEWERNGAGGLVKSLDPATGTIVIASGTGATSHIFTIHTSKNTALKRYAPASVSYALAQPAPFAAIQVGDELMARGVKNGTQIDASEVVSGTFRNISGLISSIDPANSTFTIKDLASKKQVTVKVPADALMRDLPERMAQLLAARLKSQAAGEERAPASGSNQGFRPRSGMSQRGGGMTAAMSDPQQLLKRAPLIHFSDLQKGEAVMLVATPGTSEVTAITLIAGVQPLLEAPESQDLLANWNMNSSAPENGAGMQ